MCRGFSFTSFGAKKTTPLGNLSKPTLHPGAVGFLDVMSNEFLAGAPPCDILVGGFPCQSFSLMGKGLGTDDHRGIVVVGILRYVKKKYALSGSPGECSGSSEATPLNFR